MAWYLISSAIAGVVTLVLVLGIGVVPLRSSDTRVATIAAGVSHGLALIGLFVGLFVILPDFRTIFDEFALDLPKITDLWIEAHRLILANPLHAAYALFVLFPAELAAFSGLHSRPQTRPYARLFSAAVTVGLCLLLVAFLTGLVHPVLRLVENLS